MFRYLTSVFATALLFSVPPVLAADDVQLMMGEEPGCVWCARWNDEIGPVYAKTGEGAAAPLRRVDVSGAIPDDITLARSVNFTPTFILLVKGQEVSRLEGYPGEDFFWGLLGRMLDEHHIAYEIRTLATDD